MAQSQAKASLIRLSELDQSSVRDVLVEPDAAQRAEIARDLGLLALRKLRFEGKLHPEGRRDWRLEARLGATVAQPCVVTLEPVTTRIDEDVTRRYQSDLPDPEPGEVEMPEDDTVEPLPAVLDIRAVMIEALSLALPAYPRAADVEPIDIAVTEPGKVPLTDDDVKPFAGLATLRDKLGGGSSE